MLGDLNYLAIIVCTVFSMILGFIWYTPITFGNVWMREVGLNAADIKPADAIKGYLFSLLSSFIQVMVLGVFMRLMGAATALQGLYAGAAVGIGFIALTFISNDMYEQRSFTLSLINSGYRIIYFAVSGAILGAWR